jgi:hypothetical protein
MRTENVSGIGIRYSSKHKNKTVLFFEYVCDKCNNHIFVELDFMTIKDFVNKMRNEKTDIDSNLVRRDTDVSTIDKKENKSRISIEEIKQMKEVLDKSVYWDDILINVGLTQEEIDKYKEDGIKECNDIRKENKNKNV